MRNQETQEYFSNIKKTQSTEKKKKIIYETFEFADQEERSKIERINKEEASNQVKMNYFSILTGKIQVKSSEKETFSRIEVALPLLKQERIKSFIAEIESDSPSKLNFESEETFNYLVLSLLNKGRDFFFDHSEEEIKEKVEHCVLFHLLNSIIKSKIKTNFNDKIQSILNKTEKSEEDKVIDELFKDKDRAFLKTAYSEEAKAIEELSEEPDSTKMLNYFKPQKFPAFDLENRALLQEQIKDQVVV